MTSAGDRTLTADVSPEMIEAMFRGADGHYRFARWGRPVAPVVFGVTDETLGILKGAIEAVANLAGHEIAETDPELGSNLMMFFLKDWAELLDVPDLDRIVPDLAAMVARLRTEDAHHYRLFRFDDGGAIRACFGFIRMTEDAQAVPAENIALVQTVQAFLLWGDRAFYQSSPLIALPGGDKTVLRPDIAGIIRAAYDPAMPDVADDPSHALRLFARIGAAK